MLVSACGGGGTATDTSSIVPATPQVAAKNAVAFSTANNAPVTACPIGGITVHSGVDINGNGVLDQNEVSNTQYVCNGSNGANGVGALVAATSEPAGNNCANGGSKISSGSDTNGNGILDSAEISSVSYICNGVSGSNGTNGLNTLVKIIAGVAGNICPSNGSISFSLASRASVTNLFLCNLAGDAFSFIICFCFCSATSSCCVVTNPISARVWPKYFLIFMSMPFKCLN